MPRGYNPLMPYSVDGHNLRPKSGIRLEAVDDELQLITALQDFARQERTDIEVYFDGAPPGSAGSRRFGRIRAHFVPAGSTADAAIQARLITLGPAALKWTVVSSDHQVQDAARRARARSLRSEEFALMVRQAAMEHARGGGKDDRGERKLSRREVDEWLKLFKKEE